MEQIFEKVIESNPEQSIESLYEKIFNMIDCIEGARKISKQEQDEKDGWEDYDIIDVNTNEYHNIEIADADEDEE